MDEGGLLDQSQSLAGHDTRDDALEAAGAKRPIGRLAEVDEVGGGDRLPVLGARVLRGGCGVERGRRDRPGDHLAHVPDPAAALRSTLLEPSEAAAMDAHGGKDAAVLVALFGATTRPGLVFTERRADLRRHAGEISFPGGRPDDAR